MKKSFIAYLKAKKNLSDKIKNMTMEEKIKEIDYIYETLKDLPNDVDYDLLAQNVKLEEEVYYQAKASGVPKEYLKKIENLINLGKNSLKNKKKSQKAIKVNSDNENSLDKLFDDLDNDSINNSTDSLSTSNHENVDDKKINKDKFTYEAGDIEILNSQCELCIYNDSENENACIQYPDGKPKGVLENNILCSKMSKTL